MERATPVRKSHTSTSDLLTWSEAPSSGFASSANVSRSAARPKQPSDGISKVFGGRITDEEAQSLNKRKTEAEMKNEIPVIAENIAFVAFRKPCSGYKLKEMSGSKIFSDNGEDGTSKSGTSDGNYINRTSVRIVQQTASGISQISFSTEERISPKKPSTVPEFAKQRELCGTLEGQSESRVKKQHSNAKSKELSGNDIFGPPPEIHRRSSRTMERKDRRDMGEPAPRTLRTSV